MNCELTVLAFPFIDSLPVVIIVTHLRLQMPTYHYSVVMKSAAIVMINLNDVVKSSTDVTVINSCRLGQATGGRLNDYYY